MGVGSNGKRQKNLLYVDRGSITFIQHALFQKNAAKPAVLALGSDITKDMEIVSADKFFQALTAWVETSKIPPCDLVIVLSDTVYFEYAIQSLAPGKEEEQIKTFLDTVPFEQSVSRVITDDSSKRVIVLSKDYYDLLLEFLEKKLFRVLALIPASLIGVKGPEDVKVDQLIKNLDDKKKYNFLSDFERHFISDSFITRNAPKDTKNLKIMFGVFSLLIVVLLAVIYLTFIRKP